MTKKLLSVMASAAILATGASAFDIFDDGWVPGGGIPYTFDNTIAASPFAAPSQQATTPIAIGTEKQQGDALLFPAFFVGNGWETTVRVVNTSTTNAVVAKVVLYAGDDSRELRDFNIYLSAGDVWTGTIKIDTDGNARLISTDDSAPLPGGGMADANNPMKTDPIAVPAGYIAVIGCAMTVDPTRDFLGAAGAALAAVAPSYADDFKDARAHQDHAALRTSYNATVQGVRAIATPTIFNNGVITSGANVPNVNLATAVTPASNIDDNQADYFFTDVADVLEGDVRITDTVNGKDMIMPAIVLRNVTDDATNQALLFAEGEAANIADRHLVGVNGGGGSAVPAVATSPSEYNYINLVADIAVFNTSNVWMTYGDSSSLVNNQLVLTSPFKRVAIFADVAGLNAGTTPIAVTSNGNIPSPAGYVGGVYAGVQSANNQITDFGYYTALALVYDESENQAQASQFSPATTPTLNFKYEVSATEGNPTATDNLSYYLQQAQANGGFEKGYTLMQFIVNGASTPVPTIVTQMIATDAGGRVITNWTVPAQN